MNVMMSARRWARRAAAVMAVVSLGAASTGAWAEDDPPGRVGRVAEVQGKVWMLEAGQGEWFELERNRPFTTGDRIATDNQARVELQIGSTTVRLDEGTDLDVTRLDDDRIDLTLHDGAASARVREPEVVPEFRIITPEGGFAPRVPGLYRIDRGERGTFAAVTQGELQFESRDSQMAVKAGQRAEFWTDVRDQATHFTWAQPANDDFEQWVRQDDRAEVRYSTARPISPEMTGAEDLDRNGQWDTHPEYGAVWYPTTVVAGWAPYRYGRWAWVRPWGWTWVDDAPWGFAPFHYGRWVSWRGRWVWAPGQYVRRPVYAPAMVAWVGGSNASVSITLGGRATPAVGWVPLAPREVYYPSYRVSPVYIQKVNVTHIHIDRPDRRPDRPVMYTNRGVPGGITVVPRDVLTQRQPVARAQRPADTVVMRETRDQRATPDAPPPPPNASNAPRVVRTGNAAVQPAVPRPPVDRPRSNLREQESVDPRPSIGPRNGPQVRNADNGNDDGGRRNGADDGNRRNGTPVPRATTQVPVAPVGGAPAAPAARQPQAEPPAQRVREPQESPRRDLRTDQRDMREPTRRGDDPEPRDQRALREPQPQRAVPTPPRTVEPAAPRIVPQPAPVQPQPAQPREVQPREVQPREVQPRDVQREQRQQQREQMREQREQRQQQVQQQREGGQRGERGGGGREVN